MLCVAHKSHIHRNDLQKRCEASTDQGNGVSRPIMACSSQRDWARLPYMHISDVTRDVVVLPDGGLRFVKATRAGGKENKRHVAIPWRH